MFDYLQSADSTSKDDRQFCLVGVRPSTKQVYLEHYSKVAKGEDSYITTDLSLGAYSSYMNGTWTEESADGYNDWVSLNSGVYTASTNSTFSFAIGIIPVCEPTEDEAKENSQYQVFIGKDAASLKELLDSESEDLPAGVQFVGEYKGANIGSFKYTDPDSKQSETIYGCVGGVCAYANAPSGTKVVATYTTGKTSGEDYLGSLFDETIEE